MTRTIRRCPQCRARDGEHYPECTIPTLTTLTERAETPGRATTRRNPFWRRR